MAGNDVSSTTIAGTSRVDWDIAWANFNSKAEGARIASRQLW
jgi:hypothetical protein